MATAIQKFDLEVERIRRTNTPKHDSSANGCQNESPDKYDDSETFHFNCPKDASRVESKVRSYADNNGYSFIHSCCSGKGWMISKKESKKE